MNRNDREHHADAGRDRAHRRDDALRYLVGAGKGTRLDTLQAVEERR